MILQKEKKKNTLNQLVLKMDQYIFQITFLKMVISKVQLELYQILLHLNILKTLQMKTGLNILGIYGSLLLKQIQLKTVQKIMLNLQKMILKYQDYYILDMTTHILNCMTKQKNILIMKLKPLIAAVVVVVLVSNY